MVGNGVEDVVVTVVITVVLGIFVVVVVLVVVLVLVREGVTTSFDSTCNFCGSFT